MSCGAFVVFWSGYYCLSIKSQNWLRLYYICTSFFILNSIITVFSGYGAHNGFLKWNVLKECDLKLALAMSVIETVLYACICGIGVYNLVKVRRHFSKSDAYPPIQQAQVSERSARAQPNSLFDIAPDTKI